MPGGARFEKHRDAVGADRRAVTAVAYLNERWDAADGGALRLWPPGGGDAIDVVPESNRLVLFLSRLVAHEVLPARAPRRAVSMWFSEPGGEAG